MTQIAGKTLHTETGRQCKVETLLGSGGQGEVYQVRVDGQPYALKWYFPEYLPADRDLRERLEAAVEQGVPNNRVRWPLKPVSSPDGRTFGCLWDMQHWV